MPNKIIFSFLVFFIICPITDTFAAKFEVADGEAFMKNRDIEGCYKAAKIIAFKNGLKQATGTYIESMTRVKNYEIDTDDIVEKIRGTIKSYKILKRKRRGNTCSVKVRIYINSFKASTIISNEIKRQMEELEGQQSMVELGVIVAVKVGNSYISNTNKAKTSLSQELSSLGVVTKRTGNVGVKYIEALRGSSGFNFERVTNDFLKDVLRNNNVTVKNIVIGEVEVKAHGRDSGSTKYISKATIALEATQLPSLIHTGSFTSKEPYLEYGDTQEEANQKVLIEAITNGVYDLVKIQILPRLAKNRKKRKTYTLKFIGYNNLYEPEDITDVLMETHNVEFFDDEYFDGDTSYRASFYLSGGKREFSKIRRTLKKIRALKKCKCKVRTKGGTITIKK